MNTDAKEYTFNQDYPLGRKLKGDKIMLAKVPPHLKEFFEETATTGVVKKKPHLGEIPTDSDSKETIIKFLHDNGIKDTRGLNKDDLIMLVQPFYTD